MINHIDNIKEYVEERLKKAVKGVTPYKKHLVRSSKIVRFLSQHTISSIANILRLVFILTKVRQKLSKNHSDKFMHLRIILIGVIGLHQKEKGALVNIDLLDTRNNTIGEALLASVVVDMS